MSDLIKAIELAGGQTELAEKIVEYRKARGFPCSVRQQHVWKWLNHQSGSDRVPAEYCIPIEEITAGEVTRYQLRPDVFGTSADCRCPESKEAAYGAKVFKA